MRALLVTNPRARRGALGNEVRSELLRRGIDIAKPADRAPIDAIVVAGGDGTVAREVGRALALRVPLGVVPLGTFNDLARALNLPADISPACDVIARGATRRIDVGCVNGEQYFLTEASIGVSSRLTHLLRASDKQRFGLLAVALNALRAIGHLRPIRAEIAYDDRQEYVRTIQLTVANSQRFGGFISVEGAGIDDGFLDLYAVQGSLAGTASLISAILRHRSSGSGSGLLALRSTRFAVTTRHRHRITADGEPAGVTPAYFNVLPRSLEIFVP